MLISVVIPHLNQEEHLAAGLEALHAQEDVTAEIEIIVVDNGSRRMPEEVCARWPEIVLLREETPGPGPARNLGVSVAKGDILSFIDADCRAHPRWLNAIETSFADPATRVIGGDVRVGYADPQRPTEVEPFEAIYSFRNDKHIAKGFSGAGNLAMRSEVMDRVGPFAGLEVAEDRDWGMRAGKLGDRARYVAEMIVYHPPRPNFADLKLKWDRHIAHDYELIANKSAGTLRWLGRAIAVAGSPVFEFWRVATTPRISGFHERRLAFVCLCRLRFYRGFRMVMVAFSRNARKGSEVWNRE